MTKIQPVVDYAASCAAKNAPTGKAQEAAKKTAEIIEKKASQLADEAYKAAHSTLPETKNVDAAKLAEAYRAAHGIPV